MFFSFNKRPMQVSFASLFWCTSFFPPRRFTADNFEGSRTNGSLVSFDVSGSFWTYVHWLISKVYIRGFQGVFDTLVICLLCWSLLMYLGLFLHTFPQVYSRGFRGFSDRSQHLINKKTLTTEEVDMWSTYLPDPGENN